MTALCPKCYANPLPPSIIWVLKHYKINVKLYGCIWIWIDKFDVTDLKSINLFRWNHLILNFKFQIVDLKSISLLRWNNLICNFKFQIVVFWFIIVDFKSISTLIHFKISAQIFFQYATNMTCTSFSPMSDGFWLSHLRKRDPNPCWDPFDNNIHSVVL